MNDIITGPVFYRQRNGGKAEVLAERDGRWIGWDGAGSAETWSSNGSWWEAQDAEENPHNRSSSTLGRNRPGRHPAGRVPGDG